MYDNELLFVNKFLAMLSKMHVNKIPFRTREYRDGVRAMKRYYDNHANELDSNCADIGLLFINSGQRDFTDALMAVNGDRISLQNPRLENATIKTSDAWVKYALEDERLKLPNAFLSEITQAFCDGAGVDREECYACQ